MKILLVQVHNTYLALYEINPKNFAKIKLDTVDLTDKLSISPKKMIAFEPRFSDVDDSGLGVGFLHMRKIFPCIVPKNPAALPQVPRCGIHTYDEGGFNKGRPVLEISTNTMKVRGFLPPGLPLYAFAVEECPTFTPVPDGCLHAGYKFAIVCQLPGKLCGAEA